MNIKYLNPLKLLSALIGCLNRLVLPLRYRIANRWYPIRKALRYLWLTPAVWRSRYIIKKGGYIVRGGQLYRIGETEPIIECNRFGIPIQRTLIMGQAARLHSKENVEESQGVSDAGANGVETSDWLEFFIG